ncbi:hypothetical protein V2G26_021378 [Clonostachys chloroleuca]
MSFPTDPFARVGRALSDSSLLKCQGLTEGRWQSAPSGSTFPVYEPASGAVLVYCSNFSRHDIQRAILSANAGQKKFYTSTTAAQRGKPLRAWYGLILANKEDLATILTLENVKVIAEARSEVEYAASFVSWFAEEATRSYGDVIPPSTPGATIFTLKEPVGVCGIIIPWNFPAAMITRKVAPALAAGCSVIIKPPSETPFTALALAQLAVRAGIPAACVQVVPTKDRTAASELASNDIIKKLSFTGSTEVGKYLSTLAAKTVKKMSMELGAMQCKFRATGQTCVCANRLFVHASVVDEFARRLTEQASQLKLGFGLEENVTQGPLVNKCSVEKVARHVRDALDHEGELLFGEGGKYGLEEYQVIKSVTIGSMEA